MDRSKISLATVLILIFCSFRLWAADPPPFSFYDENTYLFSQLFRGLTRFDGANQLIFDQAKGCRFKTDVEMICEIRKEAIWNDNVPVKASDFERNFKRLLNPKSKLSAIRLLFGIKNAKKIFENAMPPESLGVHALDENHLQFLLEEKDTEFVEKLSNPIFTPYRHSNVTNGPYQIKSWDKNKKIELVPFDGYFSAKKNRPSVNVYPIADNGSALMLYEKGIINFLWRLKGTEISKYKNRPDFLQTSTAQFDYIGFNIRPGSPFEKKEVREAFSHSLNFDDFKKQFSALSFPGCPGLGDPLLNPGTHCIDYRPGLSHLVLPPIKFMFGDHGDGLEKAAQWFESQWHDHLGVTVKLSSQSKIAADVFRVKVILDRPTCLGALEKFKKGDPENDTGFYNQRFENLTEALSKQKLSLSEKESVCGVAADILFKEECVGIPLGTALTPMLVNTHYKGWTLNSLNQLDLSQLTFVP